MCRMTYCRQLNVSRLYFRRLKQHILEQVYLPKIGMVTDCTRKILESRMATALRIIVVGTFYWFFCSSDFIIPELIKINCLNKFDAPTCRFENDDAPHDKTSSLKYCEVEVTGPLVKPCKKI